MPRRLHSTEPWFPNNLYAGDKIPWPARSNPLEPVAVRFLREVLLSDSEEPLASSKANLLRRARGLGHLGVIVPKEAATLELWDEEVDNLQRKYHEHLLEQIPK